MKALPAPLTFEERTDLYLLFREKNRRLTRDFERLLRERPYDMEALAVNTLRYRINGSHMTSLVSGVLW